jgi:iron complex outermembrane receptor protein
MRSFVGLLLAFACSLLLGLPVQAQTSGRKGTITGRVIDSSGGVLQGAQISVEPSGVTAVSDAQGQFLINGLEAGTYTVKVTYVGLAEFIQKVAVTPGQASSPVLANLGVESQNLEVLVTAERPSAEAEEVNRERTADNIVRAAKLVGVLAGERPVRETCPVAL